MSTVGITSIPVCILKKETSIMIILVILIMITIMIPLILIISTLRGIYFEK